jgi:hypothetical protein
MIEFSTSNGHEGRQIIVAGITVTIGKSLPKEHADILNCYESTAINHGWCMHMAPTSGLVCTREPGHAGLHVGMGRDVCYGVWGEERPHWTVINAGEEEVEA